MMRRRMAIGVALLALAASAAHADGGTERASEEGLDEDEAFFEFLGTFVDEDGDWLDALALEPFVRQRAVGSRSADGNQQTTADGASGEHESGERRVTVESDGGE